MEAIYELSPRVRDIHLNAITWALDASDEQLLALELKSRFEELRSVYMPGGVRWYSQVGSDYITRV